MAAPPTGAGFDLVRRSEIEVEPRRRGVEGLTEALIAVGPVRRRVHVVLLSSWSSWSRARLSRLLTVPGGTPSDAAVVASDQSR